MTTSTMEKIKVMLAFDEGKKIEYRYLYGDSPNQWKSVTKSRGCCWNWDSYEYRIAPQPPRKFVRWFHEDSKGNLLGMYNSKESAENVARHFVHEYRKIVAFEMVEIP